MKVWNLYLFTTTVLKVHVSGVYRQRFLPPPGHNVREVSSLKTSYVYLVSVQRNLESHHGHICGGSIISKRHVLTSTHCVHDKTLQYRVVAGSRNLNVLGHLSQRLVVSDVIHYSEAENTWPFGSGKDISVLKLRKSFTWSDSVKPVKLPDSSTFQAFGEVQFPGWGQLAPISVISSDTLHFNNLKILLLSECRKKLRGFPEYYNVNELTICTDGPYDVMNCWGDLGGPLIKDGVQIGISSWNFSPCGTGRPLVFTSTAMFIHWIQAFT